MSNSEHHQHQRAYHQVQALQLGTAYLRARGVALVPDKGRMQEARQALEAMGLVVEQDRLTLWVTAPEPEQGQDVEAIAQGLSDPMRDAIGSTGFQGGTLHPGTCKALISRGLLVPDGVGADDLTPLGRRIRAYLLAQRQADTWSDPVQVQGQGDDQADPVQVPSSSSSSTVDVMGHALVIDQDTPPAYAHCGATVYSASTGYVLGYVRTLPDRRYQARAHEDYQVHGAIPEASSLYLKPAHTLTDALAPLVELAPAGYLEADPTPVQSLPGALLPVGVDVDAYAAVSYGSAPATHRYVRLDGRPIGLAILSGETWSAIVGTDPTAKPIGRASDLVTAAHLVARAHQGQDLKADQGQGVDPVKLNTLSIGQPFTVARGYLAPGGSSDAGVLYVAGSVGQDYRIPTTDGRRLQACELVHPVDGPEVIPALSTDTVPVVHLERDRGPFPQGRRFVYRGPDLHQAVERAQGIPGAIVGRVLGQGLNLEPVATYLVLSCLVSHHPGDIGHPANDTRTRAAILEGRGDGLEVEPFLMWVLRQGPASANLLADLATAAGTIDHGPFLRKLERSGQVRHYPHAGDPSGPHMWELVDQGQDPTSGMAGTTGPVPAYPAPAQGDSSTTLAVQAVLSLCKRYREGGCSAADQGYRVMFPRVAREAVPVLVQNLETMQANGSLRPWRLAPHGVSDDGGRYGIGRYWCDLERAPACPVCEDQGQVTETDQLGDGPVSHLVPCPRGCKATREDDQDPSRDVPTVQADANGYPLGQDGHTRAFRVGDLVTVRDRPDIGRRTIVRCTGAMCELGGEAIPGTTYNLVQAGDLAIVETITLEPHWPSLIRFARQLARTGDRARALDMARAMGHHGAELLAELEDSGTPPGHLRYGVPLADFDTIEHAARAVVRAFRSDDGDTLDLAHMPEHAARAATRTLRAYLRDGCPGVRVQLYDTGAMYGPVSIGTDQ